MTDTYLLDTNILPLLFDDTPDEEADEKTRRFRAHLKAIQDAPLVICAITLGEVEYGLRVAKMADEVKQERVRTALKRFKWVVPLDDKTACPCYAQTRSDVFYKYAPRKKKQKNRNKMLLDELIDPTSAKELQLQENDIWIACVALQYYFILVSADRRMQYIQSVCGDSLRLENWLE